jgi:hypothetical protein
MNITSLIAELVASRPTASSVSTVQQLTCLLPLLICALPCCCSPADALAAQAGQGTGSKTGEDKGLLLLLPVRVGGAMPFAGSVTAIY